MINRLLNKDGKLAKLTIRAFDDKERMTPVAGAEFKAMFNPSGYIRKYTNNYTEEKNVGNPKGQLKFKNSEPQTFSFDLLIDGSGATGEKVEVSKKIKEFMYVAYDYSAKTKIPKPLKLYWGDEISRCVLTGLDIDYTMFHANGTPLRATIKATFKEEISNLVIERLHNNLSNTADRIQKVKDGDTLVALNQSIYGNINKLAEIAKVNALDNLRVLPKNTTILFPSF